MTRHPVVVLGAGIAGLLAATELRAHGTEVVVLDKGYVPGGRMASRRIGDATFDHGAQFVTIRDPRVGAYAEAWLAEGVLAEWFRGSPDLDASPDTDGHPRYRGVPTMRAVCERLARDLDVRTSTRVVALRPGPTGWRVELDDGATLDTEVVVATAPVPQTLELLDAGGAALPDADRALLEGLTFDPCLAVLAVPDGPVTSGPGGALRVGGEPVEWIGDNHAKGTSSTPAVTVHAGAGTSQRLWEATDAAVVEAVLPTAEELVGARLTARYVQRWRYSSPRSRAPEPVVVTHAPGLLVVAGDGVAGGRVEGAARSGLAAADAVRDHG